MGEIVAAFTTCHATQLITRPPDEKLEQLDASIAAGAHPLQALMSLHVIYSLSHKAQKTPDSASGRN